MTENETAAPCVSTKAARDSEKPRKESTAKSPHNSTSRRPPPLSSEILLEIPRTEKSRLRVELVEWDDEQEPVVQFVTLVLGANGWFPARHRTSLRMDELARVAAVLREVAE